MMFLFRAFSVVVCLVIAGCSFGEIDDRYGQSLVASGSGSGSGSGSDAGTGSDAGSGSGSGSDAGTGSGSDAGSGSGSGDPPEPPIATTCPADTGSNTGSNTGTMGTTTGTVGTTMGTTPMMHQLFGDLFRPVAGLYGVDNVYDLPGMPPGCCDTAPPTAGVGSCWANSPVGQCGTKGGLNGLPPTMGSCRGLWTFPPTFDSALKYCMCRTMPNGACYNNVRGCLACTNNTHQVGGANPAPPYHPGTGFPAGGCFVIPVAELYCYNNVGCTVGQQAALAASVACQLPACAAWACAQLPPGSC